MGKVRNFWYRRWRGFESKYGDINADIDLKLLNQSLFATFVLESVPQLVIQVINNSLNNTWTAFTVLSVLASLYMLFCGIWKFIYWWWWCGLPLGKVPLSNPLGFLGDYVPAFQGLQLDNNKNIRAISVSNPMIELNNGAEGGSSTMSTRVAWTDSKEYMQVIRKIGELQDKITQMEEANQKIQYKYNEMDVQHKETIMQLDIQHKETIMQNKETILQLDMQHKNALMQLEDANRRHKDAIKVLQDHIEELELALQTEV